MSNAFTLPPNFISKPEVSSRPSVEIVIEPRRRWWNIDFKELWYYHELLYFLIWREIKVQYKQTVLGPLWAVIRPVCNMVIFSIIFGSFAKMPSDGVPYPVFVYAGLLPWTFFSNSVTQSGQSLLNYSHVLSKIYFPRLFLPAASIGAALVNFAVNFIILGAVMVWYAHYPGTSVVLVPLLVALIVLAALGIGYFLASLTIIYRDMRFMIPSMVQIWMYLSPVIYPVTLIPEKYRWILALNPMTGIIEAFRSTLLNKPINGSSLGISVIIVLIFFVIGLYNFRRTERRFADVA